MDSPLSKLKIEYWYHAIAVFGAVGAIASLTLDIKGIPNVHAFIMFLGAFFWGLGEWINHPLQTAIKPPNAYTGPAAIITGHARNPKPIGVAFDIVGLTFIGFAIYRIAPLI